MSSDADGRHLEEIRYGDEFDMMEVENLSVGGIIPEMTVRGSLSPGDEDNMKDISFSKAGIIFPFPLCVRFTLMREWMVLTRVSYLSLSFSLLFFSVIFLDESVQLCTSFSVSYSALGWSSWVGRAGWGRCNMEPVVGPDFILLALNST